MGVQAGPQINWESAASIRRDASRGGRRLRGPEDCNLEAVRHLRRDISTTFPRSGAKRGRNVPRACCKGHGPTHKVDERQDGQRPHHPRTDGNRTTHVTLPRNVYIWVREKKPETVLQAGQLADEYVLVQKQSGGLPKKEQRPEGRPDNVRVCSYCHKKGHITEDCRKAAADKVKGNGQQRPKPCRPQQNAVLPMPGDGAYITELPEKGSPL